MSVGNWGSINLRRRNDLHRRQNVPLQAASQAAACRPSVYGRLGLGCHPGRSSQAGSNTTSHLMSRVLAVSHRTWKPLSDLIKCDQDAS
jgi:hypothetical protein